MSPHFQIRPLPDSRLILMTPKCTIHCGSSRLTQESSVRLCSCSIMRPVSTSLAIVRLRTMLSFVLSDLFKGKLTTSYVGTVLISLAPVVLYLATQSEHRKHYK